MLQARALPRRTTRATQKVKEAEPARMKSKGKAKAKVNDELFEEARREKVEKLKAKRVVLLTSWRCRFPSSFSSTSFPTLVPLFVPCLCEYIVCH
jgi:hypothetical protein